MNQDKTINIKNFRQGTVMTYFSSALSGDSVDIYSAFIKKNNFNQILPYNNEFPIKRAPSNNFVVDNEEVIIGNAYKKTSTDVLSDFKKEKIKKEFIDNFKKTYGNKTISWVSFENKSIEDYHVDIKLTRTFDTLDTLSVKNNLTSTWPTQEATTGVLFGKLTARQKILDENGEKVIIPLKNIPIAIFNTSEEFPEITSKDDDGNRIRLNIKENSKEKQYFNSESFLTDVGSGTTEGFLKKDKSAIIPEKFKYSTITNEEGEFLLTDLPSGQQTFMFEVDLLKQGMTHDEVALNFFPYPSDLDPNIDSVPHFFFRQFPVNIIPTWGDFQSGYTELNITANLDMRKWATFYLPPISYGDKTFEENTSEGVNSPITIEVRDMSREGYPLGNQVVQVIETRNRVENQQLEWSNEFAQKTGKINFRKYDTLIFKVPANMYDPNGLRTDKDGIPMLQQNGVWLAGYQYNLSYVDKKIFRATGHDWGWYQSVADENYNSGFISRDHFHLNRNVDTNPDSFDSIEEAKDLQNVNKNPNVPPYDKPWNHLYPEKYKIPKKPTQINPSWVAERSLTANIYLEKPKYLDGDLVGEIQPDFVSGGFGAQDFDGTWISNRFSEEVSKSYLYKYESRVSIEEIYANGYQPSCSACLTNQQFGNISHVENGEKYQRVECGYGYFLKPGGWSRVSQYSSGDTLYTNDVLNPNGYIEDSSWDIFTSVNKWFRLSMSRFDLKRNDLALKMDSDASIKTGGLDIYRILNASPSNLIEPAPLIVESSATFHFYRFYYQRGQSANHLKLAYYNYNKNGENTDSQQDMFSYDSGVGNVIKSSALVEMTITNNGKTKVEIDGVIVEAGKDKIITEKFDNMEGSYLKNLVLLGNDDYSPDNNIYTTANYTIMFNQITLYQGNGDVEAGNNVSLPITIDIEKFPVVIKNDPVKFYYLESNLLNMRTNYNSTKKEPCRGNLGIPSLDNPCGKDHNVKAQGLFFINENNNLTPGLASECGQGSFGSASFTTAPIVATCGETVINDNVNTIPFQVI